jgi:hypothetical protein
MATAILLGCSERPTAPSTRAFTMPNASSTEASTVDVGSASERSGALHMTKECSAYTRLAGSYCTISSSNIDAIPIGSKVIYASALSGGKLDTDIMLDPPGPGNNRAFGHVVLDLAKASGTVWFSGGTGQFRHFHAQAAITPLSRPAWAWTGTYSFGDSRDE